MIKHEILKQCPCCNNAIKLIRKDKYTTFYCAEDVCIYVNLLSEDMSLMRLTVYIDRFNPSGKTNASRVIDSDISYPDGKGSSRVYMINADGYEVEEFSYFEKMIPTNSLKTKQDLIDYYNKLIKLGSFQ